MRQAVGTPNGKRSHLSAVGPVATGNVSVPTLCGIRAWKETPPNYFQTCARCSAAARKAAQCV